MQQQKTSTERLRGAGDRDDEGFSFLPSRVHPGVLWPQEEIKP